ncbi:MAG: Ig-like domain-containing protein [Bacteroidales bacterium]|nr:Ig-like domain-containing protein [Bacteroidales bacterium]MBN2699057.1 Ig-like domain-containing protein [Bacteroidales bacterium]
MFKFCIAIILPAILVYSCAQQGSPSGGPKDEDPPVVTETVPANYSNFFDAQKIFITFDEYIVLDNVNQELVISPPLAEKPEIKLRKKTIVIEFEEELKSNTTYTFNFGNAIKDLHEGNQLINYEYVFATGEHLDSLSVKGTLKNSFDLSAPEGSVTVMLYDDLRDSVPLIETPLYIGKSRPDGTFAVNNLRQGVYKLFAIKDANYNFLFDQPNEEIAFLDTNLLVSAEFFREIFRQKGILDSLLQVIDTLRVLGDSAVISRDSIDSLMPDLNSVTVDLFMFTEKTEVQYLTDYRREDPRKLELMFNSSLTDSFQYVPIGQDIPNEELFFEVFSAKRDTVNLWIRDSLLYKMDTVGIAFSYTTRDSLDNPVNAYDTVFMTYKKKESKRDRKESDQQVREIEKLALSTIKPTQKQDLNRPLAIKFNFPVKGYDLKRIELAEIPDSVEYPVRFSMKLDSVKYDVVCIEHSWKSEMKYRLRIYPGAFANMYDLPQDTVDISFQTRDAESYGKIILNLENVKGSIIVQLLAKEKVARQRSVSSYGPVEFPFLNAETYKIKLIHDRNENGEWDTGDYLEKLQPEKVEFLPVDIVVRANWDHDATYRLND